MATKQPRIALCIEQTLGHRAHGQNLERAIAARETPADVFRVEYPAGRTLPLPWAARSSIAAYNLLRRGGVRHDVALFHTQTISLLAPNAVRGGRYVVSVDATPAQMDGMGRWYRHGRASAPVESAKRMWYRRVFGRASAIVAWSQWAAASLADDYGVDPSIILVAHPGAPQPYFDIPRPRRDGPPRILFVGGDFERKGGDSLLRALRRLNGRAELVLVTEAPVAAEEGVRVLRGVRPGSDALLAAYAEADIFCLPTLADCTAVALGEAAAAGLPLVTTDVASNPEWVPGAAGILVPPGDDAALYRALLRLVEEPGLRTRMSDAARCHASAHMHAGRNAGRVIDLLVEVAS